MSDNLRALLDARKAPSRLLGPLEQWMMFEPPDTSRRTDVLHPSEIVAHDWCLRASWFLLNGYPAKPRALRFRIRNTFQTGHDIHAKWQRWLQEMDVLYGLWQCRVCDTVTTELSSNPTQPCTQCGNVLYVYYEVPVVNDDLRIAGHTDGWVKGLGKDFLIEIKSVGTGTIRVYEPRLVANGEGVSSAFTKIRRPFSAHYKQGQLYLDILNRRYGEDSPQEIVFIYENKDNQEAREFVVARNRESVAPILDRVEELLGYIREDRIPACSNKPDEGCKHCSQFKDRA